MMSEMKSDSEDLFSERNLPRWMLRRWRLLHLFLHVFVLKQHILTLLFRLGQVPPLKLDDWAESVGLRRSRR